MTQQQAIAGKPAAVDLKKAVCAMPCCLLGGAQADGFALPAASSSFNELRLIIMLIVRLIIRPEPSVFSVQAKLAKM